MTDLDSDRVIAQRIIGVASYLWAHMQQACDNPMELNVIVCLLSREIMRTSLAAGMDQKDYPKCVKEAAELASEISRTVSAPPEKLIVGQT